MAQNESEETYERDLSVYTTRSTPSLDAYAAWLVNVVGFDPNAEKNKVIAFARGVYAGVALHREWQASPENAEFKAELQAARDEERAAALAAKEEAAAERAAAREAAAAAKEQARLEREAAKAARDQEQADAPEPAAAPVMRTGKSPRAARPAKAAAATPTAPVKAARPARPARAAKGSTEAPF